MVQVLNALPVGKFWDSGYAHGSRTQREMLSTIERKGIRFGTPKAGFTERIGDVTVFVLAPKVSIPGDANDNAVVLRIVYGKTSFLLAADMEEKERHTVSRWPQSTVLKVAHHGSRNGTDPAFLAQVKPKIAVISCARHNPYGHLHKSTLDALKAAGAATYITAQVGTVVLISNGKSVSVKTLGTRRTSVTASSTASGYIGNRNSHIFHQPTCSTLPNESNREYFKSRDEAIAAGYRPCKRCKP
jgi:competence protein ComEC